MREHGDPLSITLDAYAASRRALAQLKEIEIHYEKMRVRCCQYLNNIVEQDHRRIKQRVYPMLGLKIFENARVVLSGIELAQRIRKGQFDLRQLGGAQASDAERWFRVLGLDVYGKCPTRVTFRIIWHSSADIIWLVWSS